MISTPATTLELAEAAGRMSPVGWAAVRGQAAAGPTWAIRGPEGELLAVAGVYLDAGAQDGWFLACPAARTQMRYVIRCIRLTLAGCGHDRITVTTRTRAGQRIARLAGFTPAGGNNLNEVWTYERNG